MMRVALALMLTLLASAANAQAVPNRPDLSGFWMWDGSPHPQELEQVMQALPRNTVFLTDAGAVEFGPGVFGGLKVKKAALKAALAWTPKEELKPENLCRKPSIIYAMQGPFPMEIYQGTELVVFKLEYFDIVRTIHLGGAPRGEDAPHSQEGYSIGRWDGEVLVVETTHLAPGTLTNNGLDHGDRVRLTERFWLSKDGRALFGTQLFEDPETLSNRGQRFLSWRREQGYVFPYDCDPFAYTR
jgi:hypothetical protein